MGEVYQARDSKLDRDVALKILPEDFAADPERLARFQREAKVLASLNHPNIAAIYGVEDSGETHALVLELVKGPTLAGLIAGTSSAASLQSPVTTSRPETGDRRLETASTRQGLPLDEALPIAKQIAEADGPSDDPGSIGTTALAHPAVWQRPVPLALGVLLVVAASVFVGWSVRPPLPRPVTQFAMILPRGERLNTDQGRQSVALSPDGTRLAYVANDDLYLRPMGEAEATLMRGTKGARSPVFSPDGQWIAFVQGGQLKRVAVTRGTPAAVSDIGATPRGVSWNADGTVFYTGPDGFHRVPADGGTPELVVDTTDATDTGPAPELLPGGGHALLAVLLAALLAALRPPGAGSWDQAQIVAVRLDTRERRILVEGGTSPRYVSSGHVVYAQGGTLFAVPFDLDRLKVTGGPVALVEGVRQATDTGVASYSVSRSGSLVYVPGAVGESTKTVVWVNRAGQEEAVGADARDYWYPRISPDGTKVALDVRDEQQDIWIWGFTRETLTRLTLHPSRDQYPVWTPNGQRLVFRSAREDEQWKLYWKAADGTGTVERLTEAADVPIPSAVKGGHRRRRPD